MKDTPKHRWFQISLKGLFVLLTIFACLSAIGSFWLRRWQQRQRGYRIGELIQLGEGYWEEGRSLSLTNSRITKEQLRVLLKELKTFDDQTGLHLNGMAFDDSHVKEIVGHRKLRSLNLARTGITDVGLKQLVALKELEWVNLNHDAISDDGLQHLASLPKLKYIEVQGTSVTEVGLRRLKETFPALEVNGFPDF